MHPLGESGSAYLVIWFSFKKNLWRLKSDIFFTKTRDSYLFHKIIKQSSLLPIKSKDIKAGSLLVVDLETKLDNLIEGYYTQLNQKHFLDDIFKKNPLI